MSDTLISWTRKTKGMGEWNPPMASDCLRKQFPDPEVGGSAISIAVPLSSRSHSIKSESRAHNDRPTFAAAVSSIKIKEGEKEVWIWHVLDTHSSKGLATASSNLHIQISPSKRLFAYGKHSACEWNVTCILSVTDLCIWFNERFWFSCLIQLTGRTDFWGI